MSNTQVSQMRNLNQIQVRIYIKTEKCDQCRNGFSVLINYNIVIRAIKLISDIFHKDDLYSLTDKKSAIMVLLRCGFKKIDDETYLRKAF